MTLVPKSNSSAPPPVTNVPFQLRMLSVPAHTWELLAAKCRRLVLVRSIVELELSVSAPTPAEGVVPSPEPPVLMAPPLSVIGIEFPIRLVFGVPPP